MPKILNFIQVVVKKTLQEQAYVQVGKLPRFFNAKEKKRVPDEDLYMWPGYDCSVKLYNDGIFLNADTATKFVQSYSVLDTILDMKAQKYTNNDIIEKYTSSNPDNARVTVLTEYNSRAYQIDEVCFDLSPKNYIFTWNYIDQETKKKIFKKTNLVEYIKFKHPDYALHEKEHNQPLLRVNYNLKDPIYLIPSLCAEASLPKNFTQDKFKMRKLQDVKISNPGERFTRISRLIDKLVESNYLKEWGMKLNPNFAQVKSQQLENARVLRDYE